MISRKTDWIYKKIFTGISLIDRKPLKKTLSVFILE